MQSEGTSSRQEDRHILTEGWNIFARVLRHILLTRGKDLSSLYSYNIPPNCLQPSSAWQCHPASPQFGCVAHKKGLLPVLGMWEGIVA